MERSYLKSACIVGALTVLYQSLPCSVWIVECLAHCLTKKRWIVCKPVHGPDLCVAAVARSRHSHDACLAMGNCSLTEWIVDSKLSLLQCILIDTGYAYSCSYKKCMAWRLDCLKYDCFVLSLCCHRCPPKQRG